jgi:chaperonin GroEL
MKILDFGTKGSKKILNGINKVVDAVSPTLGVVGKKALLDSGHLDPIIADDGAKILNMIDLEDRWEQMGNRLMRKIVNKMHHKAGSGRTTSAVLARAFANEAFKEIQKGTDQREVVERLEKGLKETLELLSGFKREVGEDDIKRLALTESLDADVADIIAQAVKELGRNGVITVEESNKVELTLEVVKGMRIKKGLISEHFINDAEKNRCVLTNPYILIADRRIATNFQIKNILEAMVAQGKTDLLVVAMDIEGEALASFIINHQRRAMNIACVQAPYKGQTQKDFLTDLSVLTGAKVVSEEAGMFLDKVGTEVLGTATQVVVDKDETIISGGNADEKLLEERVAVITKLIEESVEWDRKEAEERLAGLTSGVGVIRVGAFTVDELRLKRDKIEDAINSTRLALDEGIIPGGGSALVKVADMIKDPMFKKALLAPFLQMELNAGMKNKWWKFWKNDRVKEVQYALSTSGYDFKSKHLVDMVSVGIIDPYKVERIALETAISIASIFASLDVFCAEFPEKQNND